MGDTDDTETHEWVELTLVAIATAAFKYAVVPAVKWLGEKLLEKAVDAAVGEAAKAVITKLFPKQQAKQLLDFTITLPDGTNIRVNPPDGAASVTISFKDGSVQSLNYKGSTEPRS